MRFAWTVILILLPGTVFPQAVSLKYSYNVNDGLSDNRVYNIAQDERGFMWIATHNGLNRFDGNNFTVFNANNSGLLENLIWDIKKLPEDKLVLGTHMGAILIDCETGIMKNILVSSSPELYSIANDIRCVEFTKKQQIILGSQGGIYVYDLKGNLIAKKEAGFDINLIGVRRLNFVTNLASFSNGDVLASTTMGYYYYNSQTKEILAVEKLSGKYELLKVLLNKYKASYVFEINNKDQFFFIAHNSGIDSLYITDLNNQSASSYKLPFTVRGNIRWDSKIQFHSDTIMTITTAREGFFIFSFRDALSEPELISSNNAPNSLCQFILRDREKRFWIGTENGIRYESKGAGEFKSLSILPFVEKDNYHPLTTAFEYDNRFWLGVYSKHSGLIVLDTNFQFIRRVDLEKQIGDKNFTVNIVPWSEDTLLIGTKDGAYLLNINTYNYVPFSIRSSKMDLSEIVVSQWFRDSKGNLWLSGGQNGGVWRVNKTKDSIQQFKPGKGTSDIPIRRAIGIAEDKDGNIWMLHLVDGMTRWNVKEKRFDSLIRKWPIDNLNRFDCTGIVIDKENNFWFFINAYGLIKYDLKKNIMTKVIGSNDRADDNVTSLLLTGDDLIWMNLRHSIMVYNKLTGELISLTSKNGLPVQAHSSQQLFFHEKTRTVYAGFINHLSSISLNAVSKSGNNHRVFITGFQVLKDRTFVDFNSQVNLASKNNDLKIDFSVPDFEHLLPQSDYEYRLHANSSWINTGSPRSLNLNNLQFGNYNLQIRQAGIEEPSSMAILAFTISPSFFQTSWFYILTGIIVLLIFYLLYRYRINQLKKVHSVREKIASDLHDDLGSRLTNIRVLSLIGENETSTWDERIKYLKKISEEAQASGEALGEIVFNMKTHDEELDDIAARMRRYAGQVFENNGTQFRMKIDEILNTKNLELEKKRDLFLVFKEILNNIHKHAAAKNAFADLKVSGKNLLMEITDDGKGFDTNEFSGGYGISNIKNRITKWDGEVVIRSENEKGTSIMVKLPFQKTSHIKRIFSS